MVVIDNPVEYTFVKFRKSNTKNKKYDAILRHKETGRKRTVPFGDKRYEQYKDITGLGIYSSKNHLDKERRKNYRKRHFETSRKKFSSSYFSYNFLW